LVNYGDKTSTTKIVANLEWYTLQSASSDRIKRIITLRKDLFRLTTWLVYG